MRTFIRDDIFRPQGNILQLWSGGMLMFRFGLAICALALGGCATITRGTTEQVSFTSEPPGATMRTSIGLACPKTPCTFDIERKKEFIATFELEGYEPQEIQVSATTSGKGAAGMAGNILIGGLVGIAADAATGATLDHNPNPVHAAMIPLPPPAPVAVPKVLKPAPKSAPKPVS